MYAEHATMSFGGHPSFPLGYDLDGLTTQLPKSIENLDFTMIRMKLMDKEEGPGWDERTCTEIEKRYRRYLYMMILFPQSKVVPTKPIDKFWHQHILDTRAYHRDCEAVFAKYLHHFPYFGMRGEKDAQDLNDSFLETEALYRSLFDEEWKYDAQSVSECAPCSGTGKCNSSRDAAQCGSGACAKCGPDHCSS